MNPPASLSDALAADAADPLSAVRDQFDLKPGLVYLDGNSLGPPPKSALARLEETAHHAWKRDLIASWNTAGWIDWPKRCGDRIARLIGAATGSVLVCDSVSVNIFKLAGALMLRSGRTGLAVEAGEFPTDGYILQGLARLSGGALHRVAPGTSADALPQGTGVLVRSAVHYKTGAKVDIAAQERAAAEAGVEIIWDLSHAAGLIDLKLAEQGASYAVGCGYKYLNGGPGAPAFLHVRPERLEGLEQPVSGWMGHAQPFAFSDAYEGAAGIERFAAGTPPILAVAALDGALDVFDGLDMARLEAKARALGDLFLSRAAELGLDSVSPGVGEPRGGHVSLRHPEGYAIIQALIARGVVGDFRSPDLMRFGFSPLILSYAQVFDAAAALVEVVRAGAYQDPAFQRRAAVT